MRIIFLAGIRSEDGTPLPSAEEAGEQLRLHWQAAFSAWPIAAKAMAKGRWIGGDGRE